MLSKATEYAIRALVYIYLQNKQDKKPGFKEISREIDSPEQFTAKVLQTLTRHNFVKSAKGRGGGFFFDKHAEELKLYSVIRTLEGESFYNQCIFGFKFCDDKYPCPLHDDFMKIWKDFKELTEKQSIQSLAEKIENHEAYLNKLDINN